MSHRSQNRGYFSLLHSKNWWQDFIDEEMTSLYHSTWEKPNCPLRVKEWEGAESAVQTLGSGENAAASSFMNSHRAHFIPSTHIPLVSEKGVAVSEWLAVSTCWSCLHLCYLNVYWLLCRNSHHLVIGACCSFYTMCLHQQKHPLIWWFP